MTDTTHVIEVAHVSKAFEIYPSPHHRLLELMVQPLRRSLGLAHKDYFSEFQALQDISFTIRQGETVGIIGRNGSGKSTLLQLICGILAPSSGKVQVKGRVSALLELGSGFNPEFTGKENVLLYGAILGLTTEEIAQQYDDIVRFADIGDFIDQPLKVYSSGMVMRLAFSTAIHVKPDILVVDEALSVGDTAFQQKCLNRIREMQRLGVSILLVTHSNNALIEYCDRGIFLKNGRMIMDGACRDVVKAYADDLVAQEGGSIAPSFKSSVPAGNLSSLTESENSVSSGMQIIQVKLLDEDGHTVGSLHYQQTVFVHVEMELAQAVKKPCFGIQLASPDGITLWSATTQSMNTPMPEMVAGTHQIAWQLNVNFSGGRYIVAIGVGHVDSGEYKRQHRLDCATYFDVIPQVHAGSGWLSPQPKFQLLRAETRVTS
jgi:lipopolysaccharide transport system ATP-binding protein